jgi:hypothetical protein
MPRADGGGIDLVDRNVRPWLGEVVTPQAPIKDAGAFAEVVAGEVVLGVLADGPASGVRRSPALAEEVGLLTRQPCPGVGLGSKILVCR